jgi:zinc protease
MFGRLVRAAFAALFAVSLPTPSLAQAPQVPAIAYQSRTLANGLRVYSIRDPNSANVSVQVWYDVGSKDDPRGRSGFAHLLSI